MTSHKEKKNSDPAFFSIGKAAGIIGLLALLSRAAGFARSSIFASLLGPSDALDSYYAAFRLPDLIFNLLILGTLSVSFIPIFTEVLTKNKERARRLASSVFTISLFSMAILCLILFFLTPFLSKIMVPGFSPAKLADTILLTRILLLSPIIFTASNLIGAILNTHKKFFIVSLAPIFYNLGIIFGFLFLFPKYGLWGWGAGVILGALLHLGVQLPNFFLLGYNLLPSFKLINPELKKIFVLFLPRIFSLDLASASLIIATAIGSTLASGSISVFNLANDLFSLPLGVFAFSISIASFPALSELYALKQIKEFYSVLLSSVNKVVFFLIPLSCLTYLMRAYIVRLGFGRGEFDWNDTILTFSILGILSLSMLMQGLTPLLARAFFASHNTKTPVFAGLLAIAVNAILAVILVKYIDMGVRGLALSFSLASAAGFTVLLLALRRKMHSENPTEANGIQSKLISYLIRTLFASGVLSLTAYSWLKIASTFVHTDTALGILIQSGSATLLGMTAFFFTAHKLKLSEAQKLAGFFKFYNRA